MFGNDGNGDHLEPFTWLSACEVIAPAQATEGLTPEPVAILTVVSSPDDLGHCERPCTGVRALRPRKQSLRRGMAIVTTREQLCRCTAKQRSIQPSVVAVSVTVLLIPSEQVFGNHNHDSKQEPGTSMHRAPAVKH